jgi:hypothetical protein
MGKAVCKKTLHLLPFKTIRLTRSVILLVSLFSGAGDALAKLSFNVRNIFYYREDDDAQFLFA